MENNSEHNHQPILYFLRVLLDYSSNGTRVLLKKPTPGECSMGIAASLKRHLDKKGLPYTLVEHPYCEGSFNTAKAADIPLNCLAKAVLFRDEDFNYTLAVLPATNKVKRYTINQIFDRHMELADEEELAVLFADCRSGSVPAIGMAYNVNVIWDDELTEQEYLWIQAGDNQHLIRIDVESFRSLMSNSMHEHFSTSRRYHQPRKPNPQGYRFSSER